MRDDDCLAAGLPRRGTPFNFRDNAARSFPLSPSRRTADQRLFPIERYLCLLKTFAAGSSWINVEREDLRRWNDFPKHHPSMHHRLPSFLILFCKLLEELFVSRILMANFIQRSVSYFSCFLDINK